MDSVPDEQAGGMISAGPPDPLLRIRRVLCGVFFGALAYMFVIDPPGLDSWVVATAGAAFFGVGSVLILRQALSRRPELEVREDGIVHRASEFGGDLFVPWKDVEDVGVSSFWTSATANHVELVVRDSLSLLRYSSMARWPGILASRSMHRGRLLLRPPSEMTADAFRTLIESRLLQAEHEAILKGHEHQDPI